MVGQVQALPDAERGRGIADRLDRAVHAEDQRLGVPGDRDGEHRAVLVQLEPRVRDGARMVGGPPEHRLVQQAEDRARLAFAQGGGAERVTGERRVGRRDGAPFPSASPIATPTLPSSRSTTS